MACARKGCSCPMGDNTFEYEGKVYCCEKCAKVCRDDHCECGPGDRSGG